MGDPSHAAMLTEERAEEFYEEAPCGYLSWQGVDGPILRANRAFCRWTGYRAEELVGVRRLEELLTPAARIMHVTRHAQLLLTLGVAERIVLELVCANGGRLPVLASSAVKREAGGTPALTQMVVFDATAYRQNEQRLMEARDRAEQSEAETRRALARAEAADRGKARFLAAMSHELRTPVSIITGYAELLLLNTEQSGLRGEGPDWVREMSAAATHLLELLEDTTRFARLDEAERRFAPSPAELWRIASAGLVEAEAALKRAQVDVVLAAGTEIWATLDRQLATNAVAGVLRELGRRMPPGAPLRLHCRDDPARIELRCPTLTLSPETLASLEAPLDAAMVMHRGLEGAGLGIAVAGRIAALHGGALRIVGEPGGGTIATLRFGSP